MNFLAHMFLSCERESLVVGNFLADFIGNRDLPRFSEPVVEGVRLHRKIDSYTDNHHIVRRGAHRLYPYHGKYAPVVIDVFYDYFLTRNWAIYSNESLREFTDRIYRTLLRHQEIMPVFLQKRLQLMIQDDWLMSYGHLEGLERSFQRMKGRASKPALLEGTTTTLQKFERELDEEFQIFFPDVIAYVRNECLC